LIAFEMAAQLAERGKPMRELVLLDPGVPKPTRSARYEWPPRATLPEKLPKSLRHLLGSAAGASHASPAQEPSPMIKPNSCADWKKGQRRDS